MNQSRKLTLSKETLRSLDDQDLTGVVGGSNSNSDHNSHGGDNNNSFVCSGICVSYQCNSFACIQV